MKGLACLLSAVVALAGVLVYIAHASGHSDEEAALIFGIKIPPGHRDWKLISVAHEEGSLNDLRALLGNDVAIKAYREGKLPFPDGSIIARLAWNYIPSEQNNKVFGRFQSFVAGAATNVQFMVKDSRKYAATGGWGFAQFKDGKPDPAAALKTCFPCHDPVEARDIQLAACELASFIGAVKELFGAEQARLSADDWFEEFELMDSPSRRTSRDWRAVTVAAAARLGGRLTVAQHHRTCWSYRPIRGIGNTIVQIVCPSLCGTGSRLKCAGRSRFANARLPARSQG